VGFDSERSKGDHCHLDGQELPCTFVSVDVVMLAQLGLVERTGNGDMAPGCQGEIHQVAVVIGA